MSVVRDVLYVVALVSFVGGTVVLGVSIVATRRRLRAVDRRLAEQERQAAEVLYPDFHRQT